MLNLLKVVHIIIIIALLIIISELSPEYHLQFIGMAVKSL